MSSNNSSPSFPRAQRPDIFLLNNNPGSGQYTLPSQFEGSYSSFYSNKQSFTFGSRTQYQIVNGQCIYQVLRNQNPGPGEYYQYKCERKKNKSCKMQSPKKSNYIQFQEEINTNAFNQDKEVFL